MSEIVPSLGAEALIRPLRRMLRPMVRLLIQNGVTFPVLSDLLRVLYVEVATDMLPDRKAQTDSRLSLLTGVHRKELRRLRELPHIGEDVPAASTLASQIISRWLGMAPWMDADGEPRRLPRNASAGEASFESLVSSVTTDLRPRAVLDEWISSSLVHVANDERIVLNKAAFIPRPGQALQLFYFGRNLGDHIAAAAANVSARTAAPFLDRSVHYDRLTVETTQDLAMFGRDKAQELLLEFNRRALARTEADEARGTPAGATRRVNLGIYLYIDDADPDPQP